MSFQEGMSPYSLAIRDMESDVAQFVMHYAETGPGSDQEIRQKSKKTSQQNGEIMDSMEEEEIITHPDVGFPGQNRRLSTASQTSMPRTLADDAFEITEARREVEMALKNGPVQPGHALMSAARLQHRRESQQGVGGDIHQSGSDLDLVFSVEDHEPGHEMPDTPEGMLRIDSKGMLKPSAPDHFEGPLGGQYARPEHVPSRKQRGETKPKLTDMEGIDNDYMPEQEDTRPQVQPKKVSTSSGPHYAEPTVVIHRPGGPESKTARGNPAKWHDDHGWYDDPSADEEERQRGRHPDPNRGYNRPMLPPQRPIRVPNDDRRQFHPGHHPPPPWVQRQQKMHREAWQMQHHMERQQIPRARPSPRGPPPRGPPSRHYGVGPFDHEADVILIPRVVKRYHRLRVPPQPQYQPQPHVAAYPRHTPSPHSPGTHANQPAWSRDDDIKFTTLPAHIDYSRRAYDRMSHFQRAHPGYRPPTNSNGQIQRRKGSDKSLDSEYSTTTATGQPAQRPTPKTRRKNKIKPPLPVSASDDAIRNRRMGHLMARPHSEIVSSDRYHGPQRTHLITRLGYPRNGPMFDPYHAQSTSALDSPPDRKLVKRREFSSHNEAMARRKLYEEDVDDHYNVPNALAFAAVAVLAAVAGNPYKRQGPMLPTAKRQQHRQLDSGVSKKGPGALMAEAYETGAPVEDLPGESSVYFRSQQFSGRQVPSQYMSQEQRVTKGSKGNAIEPSKEKKKKVTKSKKISRKTSYSSTASELQPVPEDEFEYNYEMERNEEAHWAEEEDTEGQEEKEKAFGIQRLSGKDISEAYKTSRQNMWATMPLSTASEDFQVQHQQKASGPTMRASQAAFRVRPTGTQQLQAWSTQPPGQASSSLHIQSRQPVVRTGTRIQQLQAWSTQPSDHASSSFHIQSTQPVVGWSAKTKPGTSEGEDNLDMWWSTRTATGYSYPKHPSLGSTGLVVHHHHASSSSRHRHLGAVIDLGVTSAQPHLSQITTSEEVPAESSDDSQPEPGAVVGVAGIHVGHPSVKHFGTVEAAASSRPRTAEAQASVVVAGPPVAPPVPSHLVATATGKLDARLVRQTSPPTAKVLAGAGTALEPVEEEQGLMTAARCSAGRRSSKRSTEDLDDYLGAMTSADIKDELTKKEAELMTIHRTLSRHGHRDDNDDRSDDDEMLAEPTTVGTRLVHQNEAMLMRQEALRQHTASVSSHVEQLDRELQELRMMVPARDDFLTPKGSQPTSPDSTLVRGMQMTDGGAMVMQQQAVAPAGQRAFTKMIGRGPGAAEGMARFAGRNVSLSQIPLETPLPLHTDGTQGRKVNEAMIHFTEDTDSPSMIRSTSASGMYYHFDATERDSSYKIGAIGPSVLAEKLKMAKATEGRNEAIAGDMVMRQIGGHSALAEKLRMAKVTEGRNEAVAGDTVMRQTGEY